jgi:ABC-2 type transport system ATP-binding protein
MFVFFSNFQADSQMARAMWYRSMFGSAVTSVNTRSIGKGPQELSEAVIQVENLRKSYGEVRALQGVSFAVEQGEVFGLLGPNGAGKTTTIEILEGMRTPDSGAARVCGLDPQRSGEKFKETIGAVLQSTSLPDKIRVTEAIELFAKFYRSRADTGSLLKRFQLEEKATAFYNQLSGGQKQRLALAMALVNNPQVVFLDEPTAGLDPQVRREIYDIIEQLKREKKTVLLTTHYIEEAERLCDRVAIVDYGKVIAMGTPREMKQRSAGTTRIEVRMARPIVNGVLSRMEGVADCREFDGAYVLHSTKPPQTIVALVKQLEADKNELQSLEMFSPSLEDVFIELTGRRLRE